MADLMLFVVCLVPVTFPIKASPEVRAGPGTYHGVAMVTEYGQHSAAFLGIKYATCERFARPRLVANVTGPYNATYYRPMCVQSLYIQGVSRIEGQEDCLFLNVFLPTDSRRSSTGEKRAVVVWIHGGGFTYGDSRPYDSSILATLGDVVVVTLQYRLGPFGFLSTNDDVVPGNLGLWDQHAALRWVHDNIAHFGGDPARVTLMGQSAGAASVNYHALSPLSKGLFRRVVMQSGAATSSWAFTRDPLPATYHLARKLNCYHPDGRADKRQLHVNIIECLRNVPHEKLYRNSWPMSMEVQTSVFDFVFVPTVDKEFVVDSPHALLKNKRHLLSTSLPHTDFVLSVNNNEGGSLLMLVKNFEKILKMSLLESIQTQAGFKHLLLAPLLKQIYGVSNPFVTETVLFESIFPDSLSEGRVSQKAVLKVASDPTFVVPVYQWAKAISSLGSRGRTYFYHFDHHPSFASNQSVSQGIIHGMDKFYTFGIFKDDILPGINILGGAPVSSEEKQLARTLIGFLSNFAKHGNPVPDFDDRLPRGWPEFNTRTEKYVVLKPNLTIRDHLYRRRIALWSELVPHLFSMHHLTQNDAPQETGGFKTDIFKMDERTSDLAVIGLAVALVFTFLLFIIVIVFCSRSRYDFK